MGCKQPLSIEVKIDKREKILYNLKSLAIHV